MEFAAKENRETVLLAEGENFLKVYKELLKRLEDI